MSHNIGIQSANVSCMDELSLQWLSCYQIYSNKWK